MQTNRLKVLKDILALNTENGHEELVADYFNNLFTQHEIFSKKIVHNDDRASLVAEIGSDQSSSSSNPRTFGLSGHMDVVSAGDLNLWKTDPFTPIEIDGNLFARGASDMKSGLAAMALAMIELKEAGVPFNGKVKLLATVGEEVGLLGSKQLTDEGYADDLAALIIGEPTGRQIVYAHKGILTYKVTSIGKGAHSSMPELGINAIDNLVLFHQEIKKEFGKLTALNEVLGSLVVSNSIISGGEQINSVPAVATITANLRTTPEVNNELIIQTLNQVIDRLNHEIPQMNLQLEVTQSNSPVFSDKDSKLIQITTQESEKVLHQTPPLIGVSGGTDAAEFIRANKDMQIIIFGPGNETMHQANEYIKISEYDEMVDVYKNIIINYFA